MEKPPSSQALERAQRKTSDERAAALDEIREPRLMERVEPHPQPSAPELLTAKEVAGLLRIDPRTLRAHCRSGEAPKAVTVGTRPRWRRSDVEAWLAKRAMR